MLGNWISTRFCPVAGGENFTLRAGLVEPLIIAAAL
jgi:hypothetical protein